MSRRGSPKQGFLCSWYHHIMEALQLHNATTAGFRIRACRFYFSTIKHTRRKLKTAESVYYHFHSFLRERCIRIPKSPGPHRKKTLTSTTPSERDVAEALGAAATPQKESTGNNLLRGDYTIVTRHLGSENGTLANYANKCYDPIIIIIKVL